MTIRLPASAHIVAADIAARGTKTRMSENEVDPDVVEVQWRSSASFVL
jgi:hypothetical protein